MLSGIRADLQAGGAQARASGPRLQAGVSYPEGPPWHTDWNLPTLERAAVEGCLQAGGFVHPDHPEAWGLPLRLLSAGGRRWMGAPTLSTGLCWTWTVGKLLEHLLTRPAVKKKILENFPLIQNLKIFSKSHLKLLIHWFL